jgi:hypothetical protein
LSHRVRTCNDLAKQIANFIRCLRIVFTESLYSGKSYSCCCLDRIAPLDCCGVPGTVSIQGRALRSPWNNRFQRETAMRFVRLTLVDRATRYFCLTSLAHVVFICHRSLSSFCCSPLNPDVGLTALRCCAPTGLANMLKTSNLGLHKRAVGHCRQANAPRCQPQANKRLQPTRQQNLLVPQDHNLRAVESRGVIRI